MLLIHYTYTDQNILIFQLKHFDMLCMCCVYTIHLLTNLFCQGHDSAPGPQASILCSRSSNISSCLDRLLIRRGSIFLFSACSHAAMFMRSTPGSGTLDGPSLAWAASLWPKLRRSKGSPGPMLPNERGQQSGIASDLHIMMAFVWYIIYCLYIPPSRISQVYPV